jgi:hypothetical protein
VKPASRISCQPQAAGAYRSVNLWARTPDGPCSFNSFDRIPTGLTWILHEQPSRPCGGAISVTVWNASNTGGPAPQRRPAGRARRVASRPPRFVNLRYARFSETGPGQRHVDSSLMKSNRTCRRDATGVWLAALFLDQKSSFSTRSPRTRVCRPPMAANSGTMVYAAEASFGPSNAMWRTARKV